MRVARTTMRLITMQLLTADDGSCLFPIDTATCDGDIDGSGSVTTTDLLLFLAAFGTACE